MTWFFVWLYIAVPVWSKMAAITENTTFLEMTKKMPILILFYFVTWLFCVIIYSCHSVFRLLYLYDPRWLPLLKILNFLKWQKREANFNQILFYGMIFCVIVYSCHNVFRLLYVYDPRWLPLLKIKKFLKWPKRCQF